MLKNNSVVLTLAKAIKEFLYHCRKKQKELLVNQLNMLSFCSARGISGTQGGGGVILYSPLYGTLLFN